MRRSSFVRALARVGRGILGSWCIVGPLAFGYNAISGTDRTALVAFAILVVVFYAIVIVKWRRQGLGFVKATAKDTLLILLFGGIGDALGELIAAFTGIRLTPVLPIVAALLGFWALEARQPRTRNSE